VKQYNFSPAAENEVMVYGSARPGFGSANIRMGEVEDWLAYMRAQGIQRICCLLGAGQMQEYGQDLPELYRDALGEGHVCWSPIPDGHLASAQQLTGEILPFLQAAAHAGERVVVHCAAGMGRTGHVLAAWLVYGRGFDPQQALSAVRSMGREPGEAEMWGNAGEGDLIRLLQACRR